MAILAVIGDAHPIAIRKPDHARTLHLHEERIDRIGEIEQLQSLSRQRTRLDILARRIRHVARCGSPEMCVAVADGRTGGLVDEIDEIRRTPIDGNLIHAIANARACDLGLIVARQQTLGAVVDHAMRRKTGFKEASRLSRIRLQGRQCVLAGLSQFRTAAGSRNGECPKRRRVIVALPARKIRKGDRRELCVCPAHEHPCTKQRARLK